ncbi:MAG: hypothetical protein AAB556_01840 [Patescibacteria group bacterium]
MNFQFSTFNIQKQERGQAAITTVIFLLIIMLSVFSAVSGFAFKEAKVAEKNFRSRVAFFTAEAGVDDAVYRLKRGKSVSSSFSISLNGSISTTTVSDVLGTKQVVSSGEFLESFRFLRSILFSGEGVEFFYGVQVGAGGISMNNNSAVNGNIYSNGPVVGSNGAVINGDAISVGAISDMVIGSSTAGVARAPSFANTSVHGSLCPNSYCIIEAPSIQNLPIATSTIQNWKNDAQNGGTTSGNVTVNGSISIGPRKITGKLTVTNGSTLTVTGTLWVLGDVVFDNGSIVRLSSSYGSFSGAIIGDAKIDIKNGAAFSGSGNPSSFLALIAAKDSIGEELINVDNNSLGVIYYAGRGWIKFSNNAAAKEVTAYGVRMDNNAAITYDTGLSNANFSSGPSGGWSISEWKEVIQ